MKHILCPLILLFLVSCDWGSYLKLSEDKDSWVVSSLEELNTVQVDIEKETTQLLEQGVKQQLTSPLPNNEEVENISSLTKLTTAFSTKKNVETSEGIVDTSEGIVDTSSKENLSQRYEQTTEEFPEVMSIESKEWNGQQLSDFPTPSNSWNDKFSLTKSNVGFRTVFFNTNTKEQSSEFSTEKLFFSDDNGDVEKTMREVFPDYERDDKRSVSIYSIGIIDIKQAGKYDFSISTSGKTRLILNNKLILSGEESRTIFLEAWQYTLEMEHINTAWYLDVFVNYGLHKPLYTISELEEIISPQSEDIWYAGVYESYSNENQMELIIEKDSDSTSLILWSYEPIIWNINNSKWANIREILIQSYEPGSAVIGDVKGVPIYKIDPNTRVEMSIYETLPECDDHGGYFHCEGGIDDFDNLNRVVTDIFWKKLTGFTGDYSEGPLSVPGKVLDSSEYKILQQEKEELLELKKQVEEEKNFNNIFED